MCGITGICHLTKEGPISLNQLLRMVKIQNHRGPDESGIYIDDSIGLGHTRLSVIDLTSGTQPIHNEDETLWIVYNGEIYNYPELREYLIKRGHRFYTSSDTEVVLHLYEEKGVSCLEELNGQFAFAIWNSSNKELFLARDRVGILPLHYTVQDGRIIFSSEVKSILMVDDVRRALDPLAIDQIFTCWTTLPGKSAFKGIHEIPPGHYLVTSGGEFCVKKYWSPRFSSQDEQLDSSVDVICEKVQELLVDAIRIRLRADVPVGAYLSGGLDSSGVTALVKNKFNNQLRTFGIRFEEKAFDESEHQSSMVSFLDVDHTEMNATNEKIGQSFPAVLWHCEKPLLRTSPAPLFLLSEEVNRSGFKVVLTGEGADEIFGGYNIFRETKVRSFWAKQPASRIRPLLIGKLYPYIFNDPRLLHSLRSFFGKGLNDMEDPFFSHRIRWENTSKIKTFFSEELKSDIGDYSCIEELGQFLPKSYSSWDHVSKAQYLEIVLFLSNYLLSSQGDRVAMAHAVEVRPPYLDHRIIDFMGLVPPHLKIRGLNEKYLLKRVFKGILPEKIISRPKHPYRAPISQSLLSGNNSFLMESISDSSLRQSNLFDGVKVKLLINKLQSRKSASEVDGMAFTGILSTQLIYNQFIEHLQTPHVDNVTPALFVDRRNIRA